MTIRKTMSVAGGVLLLSVGLSSWAADSGGDKFIKEAIQGNLAEVDVGQMAQQKGASQGVKDFGAMLVMDHQMANQKALQVAQQLSVQTPDKPGMKQQAVAKKLSMLSGDKFDQEFAKSMVKDHQKDIEEYRKEAQQSGPAADYAKAILPKLQEHLKMAQSLESSTHVASNGGAE